MTWTQGIPAQLTLRVGEQWRTELRSGAGGGYVWTVRGSSDVARCEVVVGPMPAEGVAPVPAEGVAPNAVLAPVVVQVTGLAPGTATFTLRLARPWDPAAVLAETAVEVAVE
jgi:hypothetical protein